MVEPLRMIGHHGIIGDLETADKWGQTNGVKLHIYEVWARRDKWSLAPYTLHAHKSAIYATVMNATMQLVKRLGRLRCSKIKRDVFHDD